MSSRSTEHDEYLRRKYIPELDGLRALSVLLVITAHMYAVGPTWAILAGHRGVVLFFVLSGYLITTLALREEAQRGTVSLLAFYVRRTCRILPLYYLTLGVYCLIVFGLPGSAHLRAPLGDALPCYLLYLQEIPFCLWQVLSTRDLVFFHSWTLGAEEKFYLLWPLLAFVLWRGRPSHRLRGTVALAGGFALVPLLLTPLGPGPEVVGRMLFCYASLLAGCIVAVLLQDPRSFARLRVLGRPAWTVVVLLAFVAAHLSTPWVAQPWLDVLNIAYTTAVAALLVCVLVSDGLLQQLLCLRPVVFVGQLSYGIYLIHILALHAAARLIPLEKTAPLGNGLTFVAACLLSVGLAWVLRRAVESPCIEVGRRWSGRILARDASTARPHTVFVEPDGAPSTETRSPATPPLVQADG
jgi:peptidoglycan/LPS O-acetylase OafA/YrhL